MLCTCVCWSQPTCEHEQLTFITEIHFLVAPYKQPDAVDCNRNNGILPLLNYRNRCTNFYYRIFASSKSSFCCCCRLSHRNERNEYDTSHAGEPDNSPGCDWRSDIDARRLKLATNLRYKTKFGVFSLPSCLDIDRS